MSRKIGLFSSTVFVTSVMTGVSLFSLPESLRSVGAYSWLGWIACTTAMLILALIFGTLAEQMPGVGPYGYAHRLVDTRLALGVGWMHLVAILVQLGSIAHTLHQHLLGHCPEHWIWSHLCLYLPVLLSTLGNSYGTSTINRTIMSISIAKYIPLVVFIGCGLTTVDTGACFTFDQHHNATLSIAQSIALIIYAFSGMEFGVLFNPQRVHNPARTIPHALWIGTLAAGLIFTSVQAIVWTHVPAGSATPLPDAAIAMFGAAGGYVFSALATIFSYGALNTSILITADLMQIMAQHKQLPQHQPRTSVRLAGAVTCAMTFLLFQGLVGYDTPFFNNVLKLSDLLLACVFFVSVVAYSRLPDPSRLQAALGLLATGMLTAVSVMALWN